MAYAKKVTRHVPEGAMPKEALLHALVPLVLDLAVNL